MMNMMILGFKVLNSLEIDSRLFGRRGATPLVPCWRQKWSRMKGWKRVERLKAFWFAMCHCFSLLYLGTKLYS